MNAKLPYMKHLHLILPGLLPPDGVSGIYAGLHLPHLEKLLARSNHSALSPSTPESLLCKAFGVQSVAPLRARADGLAADAGYWLCADPVELQMQPSQVMLQPEVGCTTAEAQALCAALNAHFAADGLRFFAPHPLRWYVHVEHPSEVDMTPLRVAAWQDVKSLQPQGRDARRWQCLGNEMQMLLYQHPLNAARMQAGKPAINSLWLWGGGEYASPQPGFSVVGGDAGLAALFSRAAGVALFEDLPGLLGSNASAALWIEEGLRTAWQRGDLYAFRTELERLETDIAAPLWRSICSGKLGRLTLEVPRDGATHRFRLARAGCWKVWRRRSPFLTGLNPDVS